MNKRLGLVLLSLLMSVYAMASNTSVKNAEGVEIWYDFNKSTKTASVTYRGNSSSDWEDEYTGKIVIPSKVVYQGTEYSVTSIGSSAFYNCSGLTSITIPDGITSIGGSAFLYCSGLTSVEFNAKNCTSMGSYYESVFSGCTKLTNLTIGENVTNITSYAFRGCSGLTSVTIPDGVTSIGDNAFSGCSGLTSVTIGKGVTSIGVSAFSDCSCLTSVEFNAKNCTSMGSYGEPVFSGCTKLTNLTIGENVTNIPSYAFYKCRGLISVTIPESVTEIGDYAFRDCSGLTSVTIPDGVTSIGEYAFSSCSCLTKVYYEGTIADWCGIVFGGDYSNPLSHAGRLYIDGKEVVKLVIPDGVTEIKPYAFSGFERLTKLTLPEGLTKIGEHAFDGCISMTKANIPSTVEEIGEYAFSGCSAWEGDLVLPEKLTEIGSSAFYGCSGLISVTIPESVTGITSGAFSGCSGLTSVTIPESVTSIKSSAFRNCSGLTSVTIPESVTSIGSSAFCGCSGLTSVTIPDGVTSIGSSAFSSCSGLTSVTIPGGVTSIEDGAFYDCDGLTSVTIPEGVTSIEDNAFSVCYGLTSVSLPSTLEDIGSGAFAICGNLQKVTCKAEVIPFIYSDTFSGQNDVVLYVPSASIEDYKEAAYWKEFGSFLPSEEETFIISATATKGYVNGTGFHKKGSSIQLEVVPYSGYEFVQWSDGVTDNPRSVVVTSDVTYTAEFAVQEYTVTANAEYGTVEGIGTYTYGTEVTLTAIANNGYEFIQWSDGVTDNTRSVVVTSDVTYTAEFAVQEYTVTANAENGRVEGTGTYAYGTEVTLTAISNDGYVFVQWSDGVTDNPRSVVVTSDVTYTAEFAVQEYTVTANAENGRVEGTGTYTYGTKVTLTAVANDGYEFVQWSDGVTDNPRSVVVTSDVTYTAEFAVQEYTVTANAENGRVEGTGTYTYGTEVTLTAVANNGYEFVQWSDGVTDNPRSVVVTSNVTYTAEFAVQEYTVTANAENGTVEGTGTYTYGTEVTLTAISNEGYEFVQWSDGVTDNPRSVVVTSDVTYTAEFAVQEYIVTANAENGTVEGTGTYTYGTEVTLTVISNDGYEFVQWSDGVTDNPRSVVVTSDVTYTAEFAVQEYTVTANAENGTVEGTGTYTYGTEVTLTAISNNGYEFIQWSDGVTDNPRIITITEDVSLEAMFEKGVSTAIDNDNTDNITVRLMGNNIVVEGIDDYTVYTISGQNLGKVESVERGIYIVVAKGKSYKVIAK